MELGKATVGWSADVQKSLIDSFALYMKQSGKNKNLTDEIEFVEILYNDVFQKILRRWGDLASSISEAEGIPSPIKKLNELLGDASPIKGSQVNNNTKAEYVGDVILYKGFPLIQRLVQLTVVDQIASIVADRRGKDTSVEFGLLAHSLGSAIAHDATHLLGTTNWINETTNDIENNLLRNVGTKLENTKKKISSFDPKKFRFKSIYMVSNTSSLLYTSDVDPYHSIVNPKENCNYYYNIDHELDPIGGVDKFDIRKLQNSNDAEHIELNHIHDKNVHALLHYVTHPECHRRIFNRLAPSFEKEEDLYAKDRMSNKQNPHYFPKIKGNFNFNNIKEQMKQKLVRNLLDVIKGMV